MPELPEVETVVRYLASALPGRRIAAVWTSGARLRAPVTRRALVSAVGRTFVGVRRRGKYVLCDLDDGRALLVHLGMSGHLVLEAASAHPTGCTASSLALPPHTHVLWRLDRGRLRFTDPRRFGLVRIGAREFPEILRLGVDPLDAALTPERLIALFRRTRRAIKDALLDQTLVAGLGNIYACEALHRAGLAPRRRADRVRAGEAACLLAAMREVLAQAIERRGTTLADRRYVGGDGREGENLACLAVYDREGAPCPRCARAIVRIVQGARSTFLCRGCQR